MVVLSKERLMEKVRFVRNCKIRFVDEATDKFIETAFYEQNTTGTFSEEIAVRLIAEGAAVPAGVQYGELVKQD
jgi:hypothetical protein